MKPLFPTLLLIPILLAGCNDDEFQLDPEEGLMGIGYEVHYLGASRGDDNDLYARHTFPIEKENAWHGLSGEEKGGQAASGYECYARRPEWEGKWWIEVALYEEIDGEFINKQRWDIDCLNYWITIDEEGGMELHEGSPPWDRSQGILGLGALAAIVGVALAATMRRLNSKENDR